MTFPEVAFREAAMQFLKGRPTPYVDYAWVSGFTFGGERITLMDPQRGIRKPARLRAALSIRTVYTPPNKERPYFDDVGPDGFPRYKYRGTDPNHPENVALRNAYADGLDVIWFVGVAPGKYTPIFPVRVIGDDPERLEFTLAVDPDLFELKPDWAITPDMRRYTERLTRARLHQPVFRAEVMNAYGERCAICRLHHSELLDAAHIIEDGAPDGQPILPNALALCKIHHAAFDKDFVGIRPDLTLHVRTDLLAEQDGWMLDGGIKGIHNSHLAVLPKRHDAQPDPTRLARRYARFLAGSGTTNAPT